ncbi:1-phosphofructokinase [Altererythrobacter sp. B11]|uniref:1-phosphofructokinase n=1 Tax=Altererythrobacter sp. B11 TaxID=2060312 RepID=UPI000DC72FDA|nr:1-phosphofructokinase [Altererythrobacter sp. B11]BBC71986.1 1-phosphofructokinase [Altererythrobacter sp. B11]
MNILTVTLNPAIDETVVLDRLEVGAVHRARQVRQNAGGKGVNVASCLADWGTPVEAHGLLGADNAASFDALFAAKAIGDRMIRIPGSTRVNLKIVDDAGTTDINMAGIAIDGKVAHEMTEALRRRLQAGDLLILSGSLPPGARPDLYADITAMAKRAGARVLLDTSGTPWRLALTADILPDAVKPNRHELSEWLGRPIETREDLLKAVDRLRADGVELVVISAGEDGALFASNEGALTGRLQIGDLASTVGAGDAMVAGIAAALAEGAGLERIARLSTAFAVAKLGMAGPNLPELGTVQALAREVVVEWLPGPAQALNDRPGERGEKK